MLPLGDESRRPSRFPAVTALIIAINVVVFILELAGGDAFVMRWAAVPVDLVAGRHMETLLSSMFMHASWLHIISNMIFLWAFGPEMEDAMGPWRYAGFYVLGGLVSMVVQVAAAPSATMPSLGASGAIAAVMGAFLITYPGDRIRTLVVFGWFARVAFIPAVLLIGFWIVTQLFSLGEVADVQQGGVAYAAHVGGAAFGVLTGKLFERRRERETWEGQ